MKESTEARRLSPSPQSIALAAEGDSNKVRKTEYAMDSLLITANGRTALRILFM